MYCCCVIYVISIDYIPVECGCDLSKTQRPMGGRWRRFDRKNGLADPPYPLRQIPCDNCLKYKSFAIFYIPCFFFCLEVRRMTSLELSPNKLKRATSTPHIASEAGNLTPVTPNFITAKMTNGALVMGRQNSQPIRYTTQPSQKGLMDRSVSCLLNQITIILFTNASIAFCDKNIRFIASRGKMNKSNSMTSSLSSPPETPTIVLNPMSLKAFSRSLDMQMDNNPLPNDDDEGPKKPARKGYVPVEEKIQKELNEMKEREHELR